MGLLKGARATKAVNAIDQQMTKIMGTAGFVNFAGDFDAKVNAVISSAQSQKSSLLAKPAPGDPFVNSNDAAKAAALKQPKTKAKAKTAAKKPTVLNSGIRKKPVKKPTAASKAATAKKITAAQKATTKSTAAPVKAANPAAAPKTKASTATKKTIAKKPTTKKPVLTKSAGVKKPAAKKPVVKKVKPVSKPKAKKV